MEDKNNVVNNENKNTDVEVDVIEVKTFTQEEVNEILKGYKSQDEVNDIINKKFAQWKKKEEEAKKEAEELAKLSEAEKQKKLFEKQVKEFEEVKKAFENEKLLNETSKQLASKNLPTEFAEILKGNDAEKTFQNIQLFETKFNEALEKLVSERLRGNVPKTTTTLSEALITKDQFKKMDLVQRQKLFNNNRELYNELSRN